MDHFDHYNAKKRPSEAADDSDSVNGPKTPIPSKKVKINQKLYSPYLFIDLASHFLFCSIEVDKGETMTRNYDRDSGIKVLDNFEHGSSTRLGR